MTWRAMYARPYVRGGPDVVAGHGGEECEDEADAVSAVRPNMNTTHRRSRMVEELAALDAKKALQRTTGRVHSRDKVPPATVSTVVGRCS